MNALQLTRPLVFFDLETTGVDPARDRIVELAAVRIEPDGARTVRTRRINPECPIPAEATAVHGIRDEDVRDEPNFAKIARGLLEFLEGADLAGFNVDRFDIPLLERELRDAGFDLGLADRRIVDVMTIFHRKERRDLSAAVRFYLGREHGGAHEAQADIEATVDVLAAQLERYDDVPRTVDELDTWCRARADAVDRAGKFVWRDGTVVVAFGKHQGRALDDLVRNDLGYLEWVLGSDFPGDAKDVVRQAIRGETPQRPQSA